MCPVVSIVVQNICQVYFSKTGLVKQDKTKLIYRFHSTLCTIIKNLKLKKNS